MTVRPTFGVQHSTGIIATMVACLCVLLHYAQK